MSKGGSWINGALLALAVALIGSCAGGGGGISGTGVQTVANGTVTGFGSVVVDGIHYSAAPGATVTVEGKGAAYESDLATGMNVTVKGTFDSATGTGIYQSIEYSSDLTGPVQAVDATARTVTLLGQTVAVTSSTVLDGFSDLSALPVGALAQVSGVPDATGKLSATRVSLEKSAAEPGDQVKLKGKITSAAAGSFTIGSQGVSYSAGQTQFVNITAAELTTAEQHLIEVRGTLNAGTIAATTVTRLQAITAAEQERVSIKGIVVSGDVHSFQFNGTNGPVTVVGDAAQLVEGTAADIQPGTTLEVTGVFVGGTVTAQVIEVEHSSSVTLEGNIAAVDLAAKTLTLNGTTVVVNSDAIFKDSSAAKVRSFTLANLAVGDHLKVGGALDTSVTPPRVTAQKVERFDPSSTTVTQGVDDTAKP